MSREWSRLTACCEVPELAPDGPVRLIVGLDADGALVRLTEAKVTSYSDLAKPYSDGVRAQMQLTSEEVEWLIGALQLALEAKRDWPEDELRACPERDDPGGPCETTPRPAGDGTGGAL